MAAHVNTVAFQGIDTLMINVQATMGGGLPAFTATSAHYLLMILSIDPANATSALTRMLVKP